MSTEKNTLEISTKYYLLPKTSGQQDKDKINYSTAYEAFIAQQEDFTKWQFIEENNFKKFGTGISTEDYFVIKLVQNKEKKFDINVISEEEINSTEEIKFFKPLNLHATRNLNLLFGFMIAGFILGVLPGLILGLVYLKTRTNDKKKIENIVEGLITPVQPKINTLGNANQEKQSKNPNLVSKPSNQLTVEQQLKNYQTLNAEQQQNTDNSNYFRDFTINQGFGKNINYKNVIVASFALTVSNCVNYYDVCYYPAGANKDVKEGFYFFKFYGSKELTTAGRWLEVEKLHDDELLCHVIQLKDGLNKMVSDYSGRYAKKMKESFENFCYKNQLKSPRTDIKAGSFEFNDKFRLSLHQNDLLEAYFYASLDMTPPPAPICIRYNLSTNSFKLLMNGAVPNTKKQNSFISKHKEYLKLGIQEYINNFQGAAKEQLQADFNAFCNNGFKNKQRPLQALNNNKNQNYKGKTNQVAEPVIFNKKQQKVKFQGTGNKTQKTTKKKQRKTNNTSVTK